MSLRDFRRVWGGEAVSQLGSSMSMVALPLLVLSLGGSAAAAGLVGLCETLPRALTAPISGVVVDRFDRRRVLIGCHAIRAVAAGSVLVALVAGVASIWQLALVGLVDGSLATASYVAERAVVRELVAKEQLADTVAQMEARIYVVLIGGPALGGLLFGIARSLPFAVDAASYLFALVMVAGVRTPLDAHVAGAREGRGRRQSTEGVRWIWRSPFLRASALLIAGVMPLYQAIFLLAVLLAHGHGDGPVAIGVMYALVGVGGVIGAIAVRPLRRLAGRRALLMQQSILATTTLLLAVAPGAFALGALIAVGELLSPVAVSALQGYRMATTPRELQGRVQAGYMLVTQSLTWVGPLAAGTLYDVAGPTAAALAIGGWAAALAVAVAVTARLRSLPEI